MFGFPHHLDLTVTDLGLSLAFYDVVLARLGYRRTGQYAGGAPCWLHVDDSAPAFGIALPKVSWHDDKTGSRAEIHRFNLHRPAPRHRFRRGVLWPQR